MENNHKLALYVAYYLSRFNEEGYHNLGYQTMIEAHKEIGKALNTNYNTIKNMRDQFDPLHQHRVGWYQAPLGISRVNIVEALQELSEIEIRSIVIDILHNATNKENYNKMQLLSIIEKEDENHIQREFIPRGVTGKRAEECFIEHYKSNFLPIKGELLDTRELGIGYDFKIIANDIEFYIEVKGLSDSEGGIMFTGKEWDSAKIKGDQYYLVFITALKTTFKINFIKNPAKKLSPKLNIVRSIQVNWTVTPAEMKNVLSK